MQESQLSLADGVLLAHALAGRVAETNGCRALFIKGPITEIHGLRAHRTSSDVDVWVSPSDVDRYIRALESIGWRRRRVPNSPRILAGHSVTMIHERWPCDIDVHRAFPGMLAEPQHVFDRLWTRRDEVEVAGTSVPACDRVGTAVVVALHALRDMHVPRNRSEFAYLVQALRDHLSVSEREQLVDLALDTRAAQTLGPLFRKLGIDEPPPPLDPEYVRRWHDWEWRRRNNTPTSRWLHELVKPPIHHAPARLWRAVILPGEEFRQLHPDVGPQRRDVWVARARRLGRGVRALPGGLVVMWSTHREYRAGGSRKT